MPDWAAQANPHAGAPGIAPSVVGPTCSSEDSGTANFTVDLKQALDTVFADVATTVRDPLFSQAKRRIEGMSWPDRFTALANHAKEAPIRHRENRVYEVRYRIEQLKVVARDLGTKLDSALLERFYSSSSGKGDTSLADWVNQAIALSDSVTSPSLVRDIEESVAALPAVAKAKAHIAREREQASQVLREANAAQGALVRAGGPDVQESEEYLALTRTISEAFDRIIELEMRALDLSRGFERWEQLGKRTSHRFSDAENAIIEHFNAHPEQRKRLSAFSRGRLIALQIFLARLDTSEELRELRQTAPKEAQTLRAIAQAFSPGATTDVAFAVGLSRDAKNQLYPSTIVPLQGRPKMPGLGIPVTVFEIEPDANSRTIREQAKLSAKNVLESPSVKPAVRLFCTEPKR